MRACWAATLLVLAQPSPASYATCRGTSALPRVLALTHRHLHKSPCGHGHSLKFPGVSLSLHCGSFPGNCALFLCVSSRVHSIWSRGTSRKLGMSSSPQGRRGTLQLNLSRHVWGACRKASEGFQHRLSAHSRRRFRPEKWKFETQLGLPRFAHYCSSIPGRAGRVIRAFSLASLDSGRPLGGFRTSTFPGGNGV